MDKNKPVKCAQTLKISKHKDGGDSRKSSSGKERSKNDITSYPKRNLDRGDSRRKPSERDHRKLSPESCKSPNRGLVRTEKSEGKTRHSNENVYLDRRKKLRERYTFRYTQPSNNVVINTAHCSTDRDDDESEEFNDKNIIRVVTRKLKDKLNVPEKNDDVDSGINECLKMIEKKKEEVERKALVKTVTSPDNTRVYKAVTFVDRKKTTPIQIKMPRHQKDSKIPRLDSRNRVKIVISRQSVELKSKPKVTKARMRSVHSRISVEKNNGRKLRDRKPMSPRFTSLKDPPTTEVAKWAPCSVNCLTRPYYEAWVDTTLAAICKETKDSETRNLVRNFKKILLERPDSPVLMYSDFADEHYAGRIKVRQRA